MKILDDSLKIYSEINECRLCSSKNLDDVLDLGLQPPANSLRPNLGMSIPIAPLKLVRCDDCFAIQLTATVDPKYLFSDYVWVTATSTTAKKYSEFFCKNVLSRTKAKTPFVLEVASNDGTFLRKFLEKECSVLGIDPAENIAIEASKNGIPTLAEFFNKECANKILEKYSRPDVVIARNVIPHVKEIHSIVDGLSTLAHKQTVVAIEFHYAKIIAEELHYDSVYHEHLFYFSIMSITALFSKYGLQAFDIFESPISGGSMVLFFSKSIIEPSKELSRFMQIEKESGLNNLNTWLHFGQRSMTHAVNLKNTIDAYSKNKKLLAYGASARSSTLLNFAGISSRNIECIIDKNPIKHNLYSPGTNIPIISFEEGVKKFNNKNILLLSWNFEEEIVFDLREHGFVGDIIIPLPNEVRVR